MSSELGLRRIIFVELGGVMGEGGHVDEQHIRCESP